MPQAVGDQDDVVKVDSEVEIEDENEDDTDDLEALVQGAEETANEGEELEEF